MIVSALVQTHITRKYFVRYIILIVFLFAGVLIATNMSERSSLSNTRWWYYDVPWMLFTIVAWIPSIQPAYYRKTFVTAVLNESERSCYIEDDRFKGEWNIKKKYPQRMVIAQAVSIILSVFVLLMLILDVGVLHHVWHTSLLRINTASKVNAVALLCLPVILSSTLVRMWSYWKYPNSVVLLRHGEWLSLQFKDNF